jgi:hypothetical protein
MREPLAQPWHTLSSLRNEVFGRFAKNQQGTTYPVLFRLVRDGRGSDQRERRGDSPCTSARPCRVRERIVSWRPIGHLPRLLCCSPL